ncbi:MAG: hypothetical protein A4E74_01458 [Syntrophus sp. PtaB.Bin075]|nr:MAG: hypothetical protein A4E74_01458 [Syntrophus sp. PtaB.Bin075]
MISSLKKCIIVSLMLAGILTFLLPARALCAGSVPLNKGAIAIMTRFDESGKGSPEPSFLNLQYGGSADTNAARKTLRAMAKASPDSKASYWAKLGTRFSVQKGSGGETYGRARITLYGLSYSGTVNTPKASAGKVTLKMTISSIQSKAMAELTLLNASGNGTSPKIYEKEKADGSADIHVTAGDTILVELELVASAGSGFQKSPAEVDFYSGKKKVSFEGIRIEILDTDPPLPIATPLPGQVLFYDNPRCLNVKPESCLILNKGEQVDDLTQRSRSQDSAETWNDRIACLKIGSDVNRVTVYQNANFKGRSRSFTRTVSNPHGVWSLHGNGWDRDISSIVIE